MAVLTSSEQEKLAILTASLKGEITNGQAAKQLGLSIRQIQRVKAAMKREGRLGVIHKLKGKPSNHQLPGEIKTKVLRLITQQYPDFKPTFATEKLAENHAISISPETTRLWMIEQGLWKARRQKTTTYRSWRPRKEYYGELIQFDGSYHEWFENRFCDKQGEAIEVCLLAAIDDATGEITKAQFAANEGVEAVFTFWKEYIEEHGKPIGIYLDAFSTYKINHKAAVDNKELMTQFQRAMQSLGITLITAHSPEAKGRVERLFQTLQDRLVKEMRLEQVNTPEEGNRFLREHFLSKFNEKFAVIPAKEGNVHKQLTGSDKKSINSIFSVHARRVINNDFTIQFKNNWYQLEEVQMTTVRARENVTIEEWLDKTVHINLRGHYLKYFLLTKKPQKVKKKPLILTTHRLNWEPPKNHPWKRRFLPDKG